MKMNVDISQVVKGLTSLEAKTDTAILMLLNTKAKEMESYAKKNAPWTDRSGLARTSLGSDVSKTTATKYRVKLAHGVDYGIWLELAHEKRFAIVEPTIISYGPKIVQSFENLLKKIK